jgi:PASTA domain
MAIVYVDCTEGKGISTTTKVSGGVAGTLQVVTNASVNVASEKTRQEDRAVALKKIKDCLDIAKSSSAASDAERRVVTRLIRDYGPINTLPPAYTVPDVRPMTPEDAQLTLETILGFKVQIVKEPSDDVEESKVIGTIPEAGQTAEKGSLVALRISTGPEPVDGGSTPPAPIEVRDVIGLKRADAENQLNTAGFTADISKFETADAQPGTVLEQDPAAGTMAEPGSIVTITVAVEPVG